MQQHKIPKDLLQAGLRPILINLSDHKRLTVSGLEGLGRLLELLTNYFKVEIGKKLLDHLRIWADPNLLEEASNRPVYEVEEIKIIVAILDIFCLLPASANIFLEDIIKELMCLESKLHRSTSSPFRKPVLKFLTRYANESVEFFYSKISEKAYMDLFSTLLESDHASSIRMEVIRTHIKLLDMTLLNDNINSTDCKRYGIIIFAKIVALHPNWNEEELADAIEFIWLEKAQDDSQKLYLSEQIMESNQILKIMMTIAQNNPSKIEILFHIIRGFERNDVVDFCELKKFIFDHINHSLDVNNKRKIMEKFLVTFTSNDSQIFKRNILRYLVIPMLLQSVQKNSAVFREVVDSEIIAKVHSNIWAPLSTDKLDDFITEDVLKVELLQLTALLIQYASNSVSEIRKDLIKFAWKHFKVEDTICKQAAYVVLARFISEYDTPVKIVIQIYVALIRAYQAEGKLLAKQALDILLPVLPQRITDTSADTKMATWVRWTRKIIVEEGHNTPQLVMIYQLIIRHSEQFYEFRDIFIPQILFSLAKLGLSPNATNETRNLTMEISEVILNWENMAIRDHCNRQNESRGNLPLLIKIRCNGLDIR